MIKNKKGFSDNLMNLTYVILAVMIGLVITMFSSVMMFESIGQEGLERIYNVSVELHNDSTISTAMLNHEGQLLQDYKDFNWYPDLFTFWIISSAFVLTCIAAYKTRAAGWMSFFGWITLGSYIFLLLANFVFQFINWFWAEYFEKLFYDLSYSLAFTTWVVENGQIIVFVWFVILIL